MIPVTVDLWTLTLVSTFGLAIWFILREFPVPFKPAAAGNQLMERGAGHATTSSLPPFWYEQPEAWFTSIEAQFNDANATEITRFQRTLSKLPADVAPKILHITSRAFQPGDYERLKQAILTTYSKSKAKRLEELRALTDIQDMKPSAILAKIRALIVSSNPTNNIVIQPDDLKLLFVQALPRHMQGTIRMHSRNNNLDDLAILADDYYEMSPTLAPSIAAVDQFITIDNNMTRLANSVDAINNKLIRNDSKSTNRKRTNYDKNGLCYYHERFGNKAKKCAGPSCSKNELSAQ